MSERICQSYRVLVGMEIHVELATKSKMFTGAPNGAANFGADPNSLVDEVVLGLPGTLPVMNKRAIEFSIGVPERNSGVNRKSENQRVLRVFGRCGARRIRFPSGQNAIGCI